MPYNDIFTNDVYQNEHDEDMTRKHPNYYKAIKTFFPEVYKLPEDEIIPMIDILKNQGDTYDEAASLVKDYINQQKPVWNQNYFKPQTQPHQDWLNNTLNDNLNKLEFEYDPPSNYKLEWDGQTLRWLKKGKEVKSWQGMSGDPAFQCRKYQKVPSKGPLPEGRYDVKQKNYQSFDALPLWERALNQGAAPFKKYKAIGSWAGGTDSWGRHRIWIDPDENTNTFGRNKFSLHGGTTPGSAGCIDLDDGIDDFAEYYRKYGRDIPLDVKYPDECW